MSAEMDYVYAVYREKSFSKAAKKLFVSQSAVSAMVKKVEDNLGCTLFDRNSSPLTLTKEGKYYIKCAERILDIEHEMKTYFDDAKNLRRGSIAIGTSSFYCIYYITDMIKRFRAKYPDIQCDVFEGNVNELDRWAEENRLDLLFGSVFEDNEALKTLFFETEHIVLGVPKDFPVNKELTEYQISLEMVRNNGFLCEDVPPVPLIAFKDYPFVSLKKGNDMHTRCIRICRNAGFTPRQESLLDQFTTAYYTACSGAGVLMVRSTLLNTLIDRGDLIYYKIGDPLEARSISFALKKRSYISNAVKEFLSIAYSSHGKKMPPLDLEK